MQPHGYSQMFQSILRLCFPVQNDDLTERFFRNMAELAVIHCLNSARVEPRQPNAPGAQPQPVLNYVAVDALVKLAVCLVTGTYPLSTCSIKNSACLAEPAPTFGCILAAARLFEAHMPALAHSVMSLHVPSTQVCLPGNTML